MWRFISAAFVSTLTLATPASANDYGDGAALAKRCFKAGYDCRSDAEKQGLKTLAGYDFVIMALNAAASHGDDEYKLRAVVGMADFFRDATVLGVSRNSICRAVLYNRPEACTYPEEDK